MQAEAEAARIKGELEAALRDATDRCSTLEADSVAATVRLAALEAELQRGREEAEGQAAGLAAQVERLENELAAAGSERAALEGQLEAAGRDAAALSSDVAVKGQQLEALRQEMAAARAEAEAKVSSGWCCRCFLETVQACLPACICTAARARLCGLLSRPTLVPQLTFSPACLPACLQAKETQDALQQAAEERDAIVGEKDAAVAQAAELQGRVEALRQEVVEARGVGTPHGECWCCPVGQQAQNAVHVPGTPSLTAIPPAHTLSLPASPQARPPRL